MTYAEIIAIIDAAGGDAYLYAFVLNNSCRKIFNEADKPFARATHLNQTLDALVFEEQDGYGTRIVTYTALNNVQAIIMVKDPNDRVKLDYRSIIG